MFVIFSVCTKQRFLGQAPPFCCPGSPGEGGNVHGYELVASSDLF